ASPFPSSRPLGVAPRGAAMPPPLRRRSRPRLEALESRVVPTTDLILDSDGGALQSGQSYVFVPGQGNDGGNTFAGFQPFAATGADGTANRTEQVLQILAGVRQDFADFDVRVLWDDRGASSPFFDGHDTVILVSGNAPPAPGAP